MSRGFVREDDQEEPPCIPPRAALPEGLPNYVTPRGLQLLLEERTELEKSRAAASGSDYERRRIQAEADGRLALLNERIATARLVEAPDTAIKEVRFGCAVTFQHLAGRLQGRQLSFQIVGVDEANVKEGRIAFTSPLARALMGSRKGQVAELRMGPEVQRVKVLEIAWPGATL
jgi:transcription elongation factor GreB